MRSNVNFFATAVAGGIFALASNAAIFGSASQSGTWQTAAQWHRLLKKAVPGTLLIDADGVEFRSAEFTQRWAYVEIHSVDLSTREFTLTSYQNRPLHQPGELSFHLTWSEPMPPEVAAQFIKRIGKPVRNQVPVPTAAVLSEIPAHRRMWSGGSNGTLRLQESGIDYVTKNGADSRAWRWTDIQTIANPNPYELRVTGYRETVEFDLKQPMPRDLFEVLWDHLYAAGLNLSVSQGEEHR